ncbi:MAG: restriction endonuclease [Candidatus Binatus sp.]
MPSSIEDLKQLKPGEFQNWVIAQITGIQTNRKSGDMGIDGWTFLLHEPVQVKQSESVGRNVVDNFETAMKRAKKNRGYIVAFSFTSGSHEEVARVRSEKLEIHLVTVEQMLNEPEHLYRMGLSPGRKDYFEHMPSLDPSRRTAEELMESDRTNR